jgi:predicted O-methyltransferase YrrM
MLNSDNIAGWFDFQEIYDIIYSECKNDDTFVEIGVFLGKSTIYFAQKIKEKQIRFFAVDTFKGSKGGDDEELHNKIIANVGDLEKAFRDNLIQCGVSKLVNVIVMDSVEASSLFKDKSVKAVFVDGAHDYDSVKRDLAAWLPKIKPGGIIAGHDYFYPDVARAVNETFKEVTIMGSSWFKQL